jgi:hypothetical protein
MKPYWREADELLGVLMDTAYGIDDDGVDFSDTNGQVQISGANSKTRIQRAMKDAGPQMGMRTDMRSALGSLFADYYRKLSDNYRSHLPLKKMTVIVLTDGLWEGTAEKKDVETNIVDFVRKVFDIFGTLEERPVTIQFIQFGQNVEATARLRFLDKDLKRTYGIP